MQNIRCITRREGRCNERQAKIPRRSRTDKGKTFTSAEIIGRVDDEARRS